MIKTLGVFAVFAALCFMVFSITRGGYNEGQKKGVQEGYEQSIGRPMKYKDLPRGQYKVVAVVNENTQTAVVERTARYEGMIRVDTHGYFLVTDMMPQQMNVGYVWGKVE